VNLGLKDTHIYLSCLVGLLFPFRLEAQYVIDGILTDTSGKWGRIHLELVESIEDLTHLNANNVLVSSPIESNGYFRLEGMGLPEGKQLYRLFLMKKSDGERNVGISNGAVRNFNLIVLENDAKISLRCSDVATSFAYCSFGNSPESQAIAHLYDQILGPINREYIKDGIETSELKTQLLSRKQSDMLLHFADTTNMVLPGIVALQLLPDFEAEFKNAPVRFRRFVQKIVAKAPKSAYALEFKAKIEALEAKLFGKKTDWTSFLLVFFMTLSAVLSFLAIRLHKKLRQLQTQILPNEPLDSTALNALSPKELEVLQLVAQGKSNKEIATALFIETSTVKSHVNKVYQKLGVTTRQEARQWLDLVKNL
jgi:DNA-binding CsgD family transcriptional regulator